MPTVQRVPSHTELDLVRIEAHPTLQPLLAGQQALLLQQQHLTQAMIALRARYRDVLHGAEPPQMVELRRQSLDLEKQLLGLAATITQARETVQRGNRQALAPVALAAVERLLQAFDTLDQAEAQVREVMRQGSTFAGNRLIPPGVLDPQRGGRRRVAQQRLVQLRTLSAPAQEG